MVGLMDCDVVVAALADGMEQTAESSMGYRWEYDLADLMVSLMVVEMAFLSGIGSVAWSEGFEAHWMVAVKEFERAVVMAVSLEFAVVVCLVVESVDEWAVW